MSETFNAEAMVRGYHVYHTTWDPTIGEQLTCMREPGNHQDPFAVAVRRSHVTVGHLPRKISSVCSMFLLRGGTIYCRVTASRRYSADLPQGGLEIPCVLAFQGGVKLIGKANRLVRYALSTSHEAASEDEPPQKKIKHDSVGQGDDSSNETTTGIITGEKLSDVHINLAQQILKKQFPQLNGLKCTLLQSKKHVGKPLSNQLQVIHCHTRNHWIVASTNDGIVSVYDSVFSTLDDESLQVIANLFHCATVKMMETQKQEGSKDCGLFAIAIATAIADPSQLKLNQAAMRSHLVQCFKDKKMSLFPASS